MVQTNQRRTLEQVINQLLDRYEHIAEIHVSHPNLSDADSYLQIKICTSAADGYEEYLDILPSGEVAVKTATEESVTVPASVVATCTGPGSIQRAEGTIVHMADDVRGAEPRDVETGLSMVREKLAGQCPHCGATPDSFYDHYQANADCVEAEKL